MLKISRAKHLHYTFHYSYLIEKSQVLCLLCSERGAHSLTLRIIERHIRFYKKKTKKNENESEETI